MKNIFNLTRRELKAYFNSPTAYILIAVFAVLAGYFFVSDLFTTNLASLRSFFGIAPILFLLITPGIAMRLFAEEKKLGTLELLMTMSLKDYEVILGKYFSSLIFLIIMILFTLIFPITLAFIGGPDSGPIIGGYLAMILMGAAFLSIGIFASSITKNQVIALVVAFGLSLILYIIDMGSGFFPGFIAPLLDYFSMGAHFENVARGIIDTRDLIYYLSVIVFFLFLTAKSLEARKWK